MSTWVAWIGLAAATTACGTPRSRSSALQEQAQRIHGEDSQHALNERVRIFRLSLQVYGQANRMALWGLTQHNLGKALLEQGMRASGAESQRLLGEAAQAFRLALQTRTREQDPNEWAATQFSLGVALQTQGMRLQAPENQPLLGEAAQAYRLAQEIATRDQHPGRWSCAQRNLAQTLLHHGRQLDGAEGDSLLVESNAAYRLLMQTRAPALEGVLQSELGGVLHEQGRRATGSERQRLLDEAMHAYRLALRENPDSELAFSGVFHLAQEARFAFDEAHAMLADRVKRHPEEVHSQANFAESNLTTGRFTEAARLAAALLRRQDLAPDSAIGLRVVELISLVLLNQGQTLEARLAELRVALAARPAGAAQSWGFAGVKEYLRREPRAQPQRAWLLDLIAAAEGTDRRASLNALDALGMRRPAVP